MPVTLPWTLAQTEAPKLVLLTDQFIKLFIYPKRFKDEIYWKITVKTALKSMTAMPVVLTWTGSQTEAKKGSAHMVLFSPKGTSLKLFAIELSYIMEFQNTHASNLGLNIGPDGNPKIVCC